MVATLKEGKTGGMLGLADSRVVLNLLSQRLSPVSGGNQPQPY